MAQLAAERSGGSPLAGDREVEWSFVAAHIPEGGGRALDFGVGEGSSLSLVAAERGYEVLGIDLEPITRPYAHPSVRYVQGDVRSLGLASKSLDLILNCSSIEHVGLAGRYGVTVHERDGDLEVMRMLRTLLKDGGIMVMTVPVGMDAVFHPLHRVYGMDGLPRLLQGWCVEKSEFWCKSEPSAHAQWVRTDRNTAVMQSAQTLYYGLGCFVLRPAYCP
ncbi:MAG: DUF268 domain-containing protein [Chloroflexi bacterium]|nr:DUF268 domain-containing protein [Chloroflexota bacterium]